QVFDGKGSSYKSYVYSFGVVAWEVISRAFPWADETCLRDIYVRVLFKEDRPPIPIDSPADIADIIIAS
ncbi:unnamed protein product, partial [Scytosiphon promiscuus]